MVEADPQHRAPQYPYLLHEGPPPPPPLLYPLQAYRQLRLALPVRNRLQRVTELFMGMKGLELELSFLG
ncbi:hypothetical protein Scep_021674 [Stephania cephalantha]|uniref:Uncharacterized protein n=1 Tax=Stephania cephalantha TaxID=152367 RepID=A0AAP0F3W0_9MAGN